MRRKLIAGNWKMNCTGAEALAKVESFVKTVDLHEDVDVLICPPFTCLHQVHGILKGSHVQLGGQDVFWKDSGAFTGRISACMLSDAGCTYCIVGHSETRGRFGKLEIPETTQGHFAETDETVNLKIRALLYHSLRPILCVGETADERDVARTDGVIEAQLKGSFAGIDESELYDTVIAYEPVWAIGTGKVCDTAEAQRVCAFIRSWVCTNCSDELGDCMRILYGGSVKASNARDLFAQPDIDGGLVGGASLDPQEFAQIVASA